MKQKILGLLVAVVAGMATTASALTWNFDYAAAGITASGTLTSGDFDAAANGGAGGYEVTGISGTRNGVSINGLVDNPNYPGAITANGINFGIIWDNTITTAPASLTVNGILYMVLGGNEYNIYYDQGSYWEFEKASQGGANVRLDSLHITQVSSSQPVPDGGMTVAMLGMALGGLGLLRRKF